MALSLESATEFNINSGDLAHRPTNPIEGSVYISPNPNNPLTELILSVCAVSGIWLEQVIPVVNPLTVNASDQLLFNGNLLFAEIAPSGVFVPNGAFIQPGFTWGFTTAGMPTNRPFLLAATMLSTSAQVDWLIDGVIVFTSNRSGTELHTFPARRLSRPVVLRAAGRITTAAARSGQISIDPLPVIIVDNG